MEKQHFVGTTASNRCYACPSHKLSDEKYKLKCRQDLPKIAYHRFPAKPDLCKKWIEIGNFKDLQQHSTKLNQKYRLCSLHFETNQFTNSLCKRLNSNAVPTLFGKLEDLLEGDGSSITKIIPQAVRAVPLATLMDLDNNSSQVENAVASIQSEEKVFSSSDALNLSQDLEVYCRVCATLSDKKNMMKIFDADGCMHNISIKINTLMPIEVSEDDHLPLSVCLPCCVVLDKAYELREVCLTASVLFNFKYLETQQNQKEGTCDVSMPITSAHPVSKQEATNAAMDNDVTSVVSSPLFPQFWCSECKMGFTNARSYKSHEGRCHQRFVIWCNECPLFFTRLQQLSDHFHEIHPNVKTEEIITKQVNLTRTRKRKPNLKNKYKCFKCKKSFALSDLATYRAHLKEHYAPKVKKVGHIKCNYCDLKFSSGPTKKRHMLALHKEYQCFTCDLCGKTFNYREGLTRHVSTHYPSNQIVCEICGKSCRNETSVQYHIKGMHHKVNCKFCSKSFSGALMGQHLDINHFEERKHRCDICGHSFYYPEELMKHKKNHMKPHIQCLVCGLIYLSQDVTTLHSHMCRSHMDPMTNSFTCPVTTCRASCSQLIDFLQHTETHDKEEFPKLYLPHAAIANISALLCGYCGMSFNLMSMYESHIHSQHKTCSDVAIMTCNICHASLPNEESMTKHLENHSEAFSFDCHHCKEVFVTDKQRDSHIIKVHRKCQKCEYCSKLF